MWQIILGFIMLPAAFTQRVGFRAIIGIIYMHSTCWLNWNVTYRGNLELISCFIFTLMGFCLVMSALSRA